LLVKKQKGLEEKTLIIYLKLHNAILIPNICLFTCTITNYSMYPFNHPPPVNYRMSNYNTQRTCSVYNTTCQDNICNICKQF